MAAIEAPLTWSGLPAHFWNSKEGESMAAMRARLQTMTLAAQAKDAALEDLQRRLNAAILEAEQGRAREAALLRRAEKSEKAEEALASQMAQLEAEAFARITQANKVLRGGVACHVEPITNSQVSLKVAEVERRLQAALEEGVVLARRCEILGEELRQAREREAALERRAKIAEEAEEALASQMAEVEAEAYAFLTEKSKRERNSMRDERCQEEPELIARNQVAQLERRLAEAAEELGEVNAKLRQEEEKSRSLEMRLLAQEGEKAVTLKRKQGGDASEETLLSLSLQEVAGLVKLKLWSPSSLARPVGNATAVC